MYEITEQDMPGMKGETPKEETYISYGISSRNVEIKALEEHNTFV